MRNKEQLKGASGAHRDGRAVIVALNIQASAQHRGWITCQQAAASVKKHVYVTETRHQALTDICAEPQMLSLTHALLSLWKILGVKVAVESLSAGCGDAISGRTSAVRGFKEAQSTVQEKDSCCSDGASSCRSTSQSACRQLYKEP